MNWVSAPTPHHELDRTRRAFPGDTSRARDDRGNAGGARALQELPCNAARTVLRELQPGRWYAAIYTLFAMRRVFRRGWPGTLFKAVVLFFVYSIVFALTFVGVVVYAALQL